MIKKLLKEILLADLIVLLATLKEAQFVRVHVVHHQVLPRPS